MLTGLFPISEFDNKFLKPHYNKDVSILKKKMRKVVF